MKKHPLIQSIFDLRGNSRACVYTEPLWAIPNNLFTPFASVYMAALLLSDRQIGIVASTSLLFRALAAMFSGAITDKLGRRATALIFDLCAWSVPCLLWAFSQNFWWFMIAASLNGLWQVTDNAWTCLLVEDAEKSAIVKIYSLIHLGGQLSVFFAPLSGILVNRLSIVPAVRILYLFSFLSMTAKFIILFAYSKETQVGIIRKRETSGASIFKIMSGYGHIFRRVFASSEMVLALALFAIFNISAMIINNFFGLYTTGSLMLQEHFLAYFPVLRSLVIVIFLFIIPSKLTRFSSRHLMLAGILFYIIGHVVLLLSPKGALAPLLLYVFFEACAHSLVMPRRDSIVAILIEPSERARISGLITVITLGFAIPFGYLAGWLSDMDRRLPFILNTVIFALALTVVAANKKLLEHRE